MIKKFIYLCCITLALAGCSEEALNGDSVITKPTEQASNIDKWVFKNLTEPYNVQVIYQSGSIAMAPDEYAPKTEKVLDVLETIKALWVDVYATEGIGGTNYLKDKMPMRIHLIGGRKLDASGKELITNPTATGINMYIYNVNEFNRNDEHDVFCLMRSVHFQFAKRLLELKGYDRDKFLQISRHRYRNSPYGVNVGLTKQSRHEAFDVSRKAAKRGCFSLFGLSSAEDDMADMISTLLTHKPTVEQERLQAARHYEIPKNDPDPDYTRQLAQEGEQCAQEMEQKMVIVRDFFKKEAGLNLNQLQLLSINKLINFTKTKNRDE